jgi:hypothetical protein
MATVLAILAVVLPFAGLLVLLIRGVKRSSRTGAATSAQNVDAGSHWWPFWMSSTSDAGGGYHLPGHSPVHHHGSHHHDSGGADVGSSGGGLDAGSGGGFDSGGAGGFDAGNGGFDTGGAGCG